jgi:hypothetical protein
MEGFNNPDVWEASLTMNYRFTFNLDSDGIIIFRNIGTHAILNRERG